MNQFMQFFFIPAIICSEECAAGGQQFRLLNTDDYGILIHGRISEEISREIVLPHWQEKNSNVQIHCSGAVLTLSCQKKQVKSEVFIQYVFTISAGCTGKTPE